MDNDFFSQRMHATYADACAIGCLLELKLRLLAENQPETREFAHADKLQDVEIALIKAYGQLLLEKARRFAEKKPSFSTTRQGDEEERRFRSKKAGCPRKTAGCRYEPSSLARKRPPSR